MALFGTGLFWEAPQSLAVGDSPTFTNLTLSGLTASLPVFTDANKLLISKSVADTRTALGLGTGDSPTLTGLTLSGLTDTYIPVAGAAGVLGNSVLTLVANGTGKTLTFGVLGTSTIGIDLTSAGLTGGDQYIALSGTNYWDADGQIYATKAYASSLIGSDVHSSYTGTVVIRHEVDVNRALGVGRYVAVGSLTACTSNGTTTITKTGHGLSLAVGELVHVTGATTTADKGFYRIASSTINTIVVDRALSGSDGDVALTVYKDMIVIMAIDAAGQGMRAFGGTADKPFVLGGTINPSTTGLLSRDVLVASIIGYAPYDSAATPVAPTDALKFFGYNKSVVDNGVITLPAVTTNGRGIVTVGTAATTYTEFVVGSTGTVTLINNTVDVVANADTDAKLDIGTAATQEPLQIKNALGDTHVINVMFWYD